MDLIDSRNDMFLSGAVNRLQYTFADFYLRQEGNVLPGVCSFVCLSVCLSVTNFT